MMLHRRATPLGQKIIASAIACGEVVRNARYVLASRHGEFSRLLGILDTLAVGEQPSPAEFSMSVHHALAGLLSIHIGNTKGHIALAAGAGTFGMALLEAAACLAEEPDSAVLLLYGDEPLPGPYATFADECGSLPLVAAFALASAAADERGIVIEPDLEHGRGDSATYGCAARDFLKFLLSNAQSGRWQGERVRCRWCHAS
jgi:hypothetical protein